MKIKKWIHNNCKFALNNIEIEEDKNQKMETDNNNLSRKTWEDEDYNGKVVTFDFDDTLKRSSDGNPIFHIISIMKDLYSKGAEIHIVTTRYGVNANRKEIQQFVDTYQLPIKSIHFTNRRPKAGKLKDLNSSLHFDDNTQELPFCTYQKIPFVNSISMEYNDNMS